MEAKILRGANSLPDQKPCLRETIHRTQEGSHQYETLHMLRLNGSMANIM